jgi:hypothetical protein
MSKGGISVITVFDVATHEELMEMFGEDFDEVYDEEYKASMSADNNNAELASLYKMRGDIEKSQEHLALIKDERCRQSRNMLMYEITHDMAMYEAMYEMYGITHD